jgi:hypothetical protein
MMTSSMADFDAMDRLLQPCLRVPGQDGIVRAQRTPDTLLPLRADR